MTTLADLSRWLEGFAPAALAETWDNVGLLWGDPAARSWRRVMTCLTVTPTTGCRRGDSRNGAGRDREPSSDPVPNRSRQSARTFPRDRFPLAAGQSRDRRSEPAHGLRQYAWEGSTTASRVGSGPASMSGGSGRGRLCPGIEGCLSSSPRTDRRDTILAAAFEAGAGPDRRLSSTARSRRAGRVGTFFGMEGSQSERSARIGSAHESVRRTIGSNSSAPAARV